jgi:hypothetical protein
MTTRARTKSARKTAAKKTPKNPEVIRAQRPPGPAPEIRFNPVLCIVSAPEQYVWSLSLCDRVKEQFAKAGLDEVVSDEAAGKHNGPVILVRGDAAIDQLLVPVLLKRPNFLLLSDDPTNPSPVAASVRGRDVARTVEILRGARTFAGEKLLARAPSQLDMDHWTSLREPQTPYARIVTAGNRRAMEWRLFLGTRKAATDLISKHLWPVPAFYATRLLARLGVAPNLARTTTAALAVVALWFFFWGQFAPGLLAAWAMTFVHTLDETLTHTTLASSTGGDYFDRIINLVHPPLCYAAWGFGLQATGTPWSEGMLWGVLAVTISGYVLQRLIEGTLMKWQGVDIHTWRPFDTRARQVTAPGNPNLVLLSLFTALARPDWGLLAVAIWTAICLCLLAVQTAQALRAKRTAGVLTSWLAKP